MAEGLRSIDQIGPGFLWNFPRLRRRIELGALVQRPVRHAVPAGHHRQWAEPAGVGRHHQDQYAPRVLSKFYEDAILSERPVVTGSEAVIAWLAENGMQVWERIGRAVQQWSGIRPRGSGGPATPTAHYGILAVRITSGYGDFVDDDLQVGHGIGYPYFEPSGTK